MKGTGKQEQGLTNSSKGVSGKVSLVRHKLLLCLWQGLSQDITPGWRGKRAAFDDFTAVMTQAELGPMAAPRDYRGREFFPPSKQKQLHFHLRALSKGIRGVSEAKSPKEAMGQERRSSRGLLKERK